MPAKTFEQCAQREIAEETGLIIAPPSFVGISNNLQTWRAEGKAYGFHLFADAPSWRGSRAERTGKMC
jgi:8-oxo-dGTP pyrophosphatase MutT (NUDIX family)